MTKSELKEMIRECLCEELSKKYLHEEAEQIEKLAVVFIGNNSNEKATLDKVTEPRHTVVFSARDFIRQYDAMKFDGIEKGNVKLYADAEGMQELKDVLSEVPARVADPILNSTVVLTEGTLTESSLTAEEKVDAWHAGTRRENYKAAGIPKLNTFLNIAKRKGYTEIVEIIEAELAKRGVAVSTTPSTTATTSTTSTTSTSVASKDELYTEPTDVDIEPTEETDSIDDVAHFSDELVKEPEASVLSDKDRDIIIGKAIDSLGKPAFYVRSFWRSAMGFIGSYSTTWYNSNYNEVKATRAQDKIRDLTYSSDKLIVLRSHYDGGSQNIDRYYSIEVPASTKYIVDTDKIRDMIYGSYYDSELDWRISTLAKTPANRKKFRQYLLDTAGMPVDQAEELTTYAFDKRVW